VVGAIRPYRPWISIIGNQQSRGRTAGFLHAVSAGPDYSSHDNLPTILVDLNSKPVPGSPGSSRLHMAVNGPFANLSVLANCLALALHNWLRDKTLRAPMWLRH